MARKEAERLLSPKDLADRLQVDVETLYKWRLRGYGPQGFRVGKFLRYRPAVVEAWLERQAEREPRAPVW